jgi:hypothetical protein
MSVRALDLVVIRCEDGHRFTPRRVLADPDNLSEMTAHLKAIVCREDRQNRGTDYWLSRYELEVLPPGSDEPLFVHTAIGEDERDE